MGNFNKDLIVFKQDIAERLKSLVLDLEDECRRRGIETINDFQADDTFCKTFLVPGDETALRARSARIDADGIVIVLEDLDERYCGRVNLRTIEPGDAVVIILEWFVDIFERLDKNELRVVEGDVVVFEFRPGDHVRWNDPGIGDFDPEERAAQRGRIYTVVENRGETILVSDGDSDVEAPPAELELYVPIALTCPLTCEMYNISTDHKGVKRIHILGWFWRSANNQWRLTEPCGIDMPLSEFIASYENDPNFLENLWQDARQLEADNNEKAAFVLMNTFFGGTGPEGNISYSELVPNTPDGNYIHCETLPTP